MADETRGPGDPSPGPESPPPTSEHRPSTPEGPASPPRGRSSTPEDPTSIDRTERDEEYWRRNLRYVAILLAIWFAASYGAGILLAEPLNAFRIPGTGFPVGFWFAQQGSIYVFLVLIFVYVFLMNRLDREFDVDERADGEGGA